MRFLRGSCLYKFLYSITLFYCAKIERLRISLMANSPGAAVADDLAALRMRCCCPFSVVLRSFSILKIPKTNVVLGPKKADVRQDGSSSSRMTPCRARGLSPRVLERCSHSPIYYEE